MGLKPPRVCGLSLKLKNHQTRQPSLNCHCSEKLQRLGEGLGICFLIIIIIKKSFLQEMRPALNQYLPHAIKLVFTMELSL